MTTQTSITCSAPVGMSSRGPNSVLCWLTYIAGQYGEVYNELRKVADRIATGRRDVTRMRSLLIHTSEYSIARLSAR